MPAPFTPTLISLPEIKKVLQVDPQDTQEDALLGLYAEWTTGIIQELLDREIAYGVRTWYYSGTGTQKLLLRHRPVYAGAAPAYASSLPFQALTVWVDTSGNFGQAPNAFTGSALTFGSDYSIKPDQEDGGSREAILYRIGDYWPRPRMRQAGTLSSFIGNDVGSIKVLSTSGYTVDSLPAAFHEAASMLIVRLSNIYPLGMEVTNESYLDRQFTLSPDKRGYLLSMIKPILLFYKSWHF